MTKTHFGFKTVENDQKQGMVQSVFDNVANKYDVMNDFMSFGLHRLWKDKLINEMVISDEDVLLDLAGGTGDIAKKYLRAGGKEAVVADLNKEMLKNGENKALDDNFQLRDKIKWVHANAQELPFEDNMFDFCTISFGIRNVTNIPMALKEIYRVLQPGGKFLCLEFSHVDNNIIKQFYDFYSFNIIPKLGKVVANDEDSYKYLVESIRKFPKAHVFSQMIEEAGFDMVEYQKLTFGVVALHVGYKV